MNIVRTVARKSSNRLKFWWLKVICSICQSNELEHEIKHKTGGEAGDQSKIWSAMAHPGPLLEPPLVRKDFLWGLETGHFSSYQSFPSQHTEAGRLGSIPGRVIPKTGKTVLAACVQPLWLMLGISEKLHERCCHWLATSAAFTAKVVAWSTVQSVKRV